MPNSDSFQQDPSKARHYKQLGLALGAAMRDVEAAYWRFARELRGQAAMAPYNEAYEALVSKAERPTDKPELTQPTPEPAGNGRQARGSRPPSKLGWSA